MIKAFFSILPKSNRVVWIALLRQIDTSIFAYLRGQLNVCLFFALYYGTLLPIIGLKAGFMLGIMMGIIMFIPYIGFFVGCGICLIVSFLQFGISDQFYVICVMFAIGQIIDANYVTPKFVGDKVGIHPAVIVFGLFASTSIFGITGAILALPITTSCAILIRYSIKQYKKTPYFK